MKKLIAIVAGEPDSINSEIIVKAWKKNKSRKNIFIIGNYLLLKKQIEKIGLKVEVLKVNSIKEIKDRNKLNVLNIPLKFDSIFKNKYSQNYVLKSLNVAHDLAFKKKITEYLAKKNYMKNKEVMMIYNKKLSVVPLTTHLEIKNITSKIKYALIKKKILTLDRSYSKLFNTKPKIVILGLNPHNSENRTNSIENKIIKPAVKKLNKLNIDIKGPFPADTVFTNQKKA